MQACANDQEWETIITIIQFQKLNMDVYFLINENYQLISWHTIVISDLKM